MEWEVLSKKLALDPVVPDLATTAARAFEAGRAAYPELFAETSSKPAVPKDLLVRLVHRRLADRPGRAGVIDGAELCLALACATADRKALQTFERLYMSVVRGSVGRLKLPSADVDDIEQLVRKKLLLPREGDTELDRLAMIAVYAGDGKLKSLLRVTATREAIDLTRKRKAGREKDDDDLVDMAASGRDPAIADLLARSKDTVKTAFAKALATLETRERNVLRLHLLDGVAVEKIAQTYGVHRVTASKWMSAAKQKIASHVRSELAAELGLSGNDLESVVRHAQAGLEWSVERILRETPAP
jgi:RNA polymerase sigma-70 factor (ECF subfamily)